MTRSTNPAQSARSSRAAHASRSTFPALLLGLTAVTGVVDAVSYLVLGHVFVASMTGNVIFLGFGIAGAADVSAPPRSPHWSRSCSARSLEAGSHGICGTPAFVLSLLLGHQTTTARYPTLRRQPEHRANRSAVTGVSSSPPTPSTTIGNARRTLCFRSSQVIASVEPDRRSDSRLAGIEWNTRT